MELKSLNPVELGKSEARKMVTIGCLTDLSYKLPPAQSVQPFAMALVQ